MNIRYLSYLMVVADLRSIVQAAEQCSNRINGTTYRVYLQCK